jgi:hypothetical protein
MEMKVFNKFVWAAFFSAWLGALQVHAQEYPEYEGVYVYDEETIQWVALKPKKLERYQLALSSAISYLDSNGLGYITVAGLQESTLASSPSVAYTPQLRVFIRSRNPNLVLIDTIVKLSDLATTIPPGDSAAIDKLEPGSIRHKPAPDLVISPYSISSDFFNAKPVDATSTEYVFDASQQLPNRVYGLSQCSDCLIEIMGFGISAPGVRNASAAENRFLFRTLEMRIDSKAEAEAEGYASDVLPIIEGDYLNTAVIGGVPTLCADAIIEDGQALKVSKGTLSFYEYSCQFVGSRPSPREGYTIFSLRCNGEGEQWETEMLFQRTSEATFELGGENYQGCLGGEWKAVGSGTAP